MNDDELRSALTDLLQALPDDRVLPAATAGRIARRRRLKVTAGALGGVGALAGVIAVGLGLTAPDQDRLGIPAVRPSASASPSPSPSAAAPLRVVLRPDGLGLTDGGSSTSALAFGADAATVRAAVDDALGEGGEMPTPDCGAGSSTVQHEGLFLLLQGGTFVGWVTGTPGLTTGDGLGVGSTLADLRASLAGLEVSEGTLGAEWSTTEGGLAGFLDGTGDASAVTGMAAGVRCLAR